MALFALIFSAPAARAQSDPLPSWNDGPTKQAIIKFVHVTTVPSSSSYVPPDARIATFDQDGTTWVSHPMYTQLVFCLNRVPMVVAKHPELRNAQPFKTVLSGDRTVIAKLSKSGWSPTITAPADRPELQGRMLAKVAKQLDRAPGAGAT